MKPKIEIIVSPQSCEIRDSLAPVPVVVIRNDGVSNFLATADSIIAEETARAETQGREIKVRDFRVTDAPKKKARR